jgi:uncharacterized membrane protein
MSLFSTLPKIDHDRVVLAIAAAERRTSGEIRVVVSRRKIAEPIAEAKQQFERLGMTATALRNGVLILLAPRSRTFAVIGDTAVHQECGEEFWQKIADAMKGKFRNGEFTEGLIHGIERAGALLAAHFPRAKDDRNELPNEIEETD